MVGNCPVCGAPWNGRKCEYCGYETLQEATRNTYEETGSQQSRYAYEDIGAQRSRYAYDAPETRQSKYAYDQPGTQQSKYGYDQPGTQQSSYAYDQAGMQQSVYGRQERGPVGYQHADDPYYGQNVSPKSRAAALILCIVLGIFGGHRFYAGKIGTGILYLLTYGLFGFGWLWDLICIARGTFKDKNGLPIKR